MQLSMRLEGTRGKGIQRFLLLNRLRERDRIGVLGSETGAAGVVGDVSY